MPPLRFSAIFLLVAAASACGAAHEPGAAHAPSHPHAVSHSRRADAGRIVSPRLRAALAARRSTATNLAAPARAASATADTLPDWVKGMGTGLVHSSDAATAAAIDPHDGSIYVTGS